MSKPKRIIDIDFDEIVVTDTSKDVSLDIQLPTTSTLRLPGLDSFAPDISFSTNNTPIQVDKIKNCPRCNKPLVAAKAINGSESVSFLECPECGTLINTYKPTYYQAVYLQRAERYKMTAGGYGSGKSRVNIEDVIKHILLIKNARVAVTARTYPALEATFIKEFYSMFPAKLVRRKNDQKHELTLTNGAELIFRSFDDETKLKSMNLTMAVIVEASDVSYKAFEMLQSRIRNTMATIPELDHQGNPVMEWDPVGRVYRPKYRVDVRHISLETNPSSGWVRTNFLLDAEYVEFFGDAYNEGYKFNKVRDPNKYVQVVSTSANPYLPPTYEADQTRGKSPAYIQQFFKASFNFAVNLVLPNFGICIVPPHPLPREFNEEGRRVLYYVIGLDYGVNDPTHIVYGAFSTETKKLYWYDEMRLNNSDVKTLAKEHRKQYKMNGTNLDGLLMLPRFDGRSWGKRESDLKTIGEMFEAEGLYFEPSYASMEARIIKMNALINHDQMEVFSTCEFFIEEALNWKFKLDRNGNPTNVPEDGNDHGITAAQFVIVELPHNLKELRLSAFIPAGSKFTHDLKLIERPKAKLYDPLGKDDRNGNYTGYHSNIIVTEHTLNSRAYSIFDGGEETVDEESDEEVRTYGAYIPGRY